jgi:NADH-quinone oxidoreductase subunit N
MTALSPDILTLSVAFVAMFCGAIVKKGSKDSNVFTVTVMGLLVALGLFYFNPVKSDFHLFYGYYVTNTGRWLKFLMCFICLMSIVFARSYFRDDTHERGRMKHEGEFYALIIFCTFGMYTVISARDLLTLFIGIELATIPLYALTAYYKQDDYSVEASTKYIIMGSVSTAVALFGYSFIYGAVGGVRFDEITHFLYDPYHQHSPLIWMGFILILVATGFKLAAAPMHMWAPDVYEGSPMPVTSFLSVGSKSIAVLILLIMLHGPFAALREEALSFIAIIAALSMTIGNLGALKQKRLRRFMAYSSIAQAGYILMGFLGKEELMFTSTIYYVLVYAFTNLCTFFVLGVVTNKRKDDFKSLRGLSKQSPLLAAILMLCMFSLAGIPPLAGFTGKFFLFASAAENKFYGLVVFAALNSTVSLYYYLLIIKEAYINKPEESLNPIEVHFEQRWAILILIVGVISLGLIPCISDGIASLM